MKVTVAEIIPAPIGEVWDEVSQLGRHAEWMVDAEAVEIVSAQRTGVGTVMRVPTRVGPLTTVDWIIVTGWVEGAWIEVVHVGTVSGHGSFQLDPLGMATKMTWSEEIDLPVVFGGLLAEPFAGTIIGAIWRRNLRRLAARFG